jgi:hypothetical protein
LYRDICTFYGLQIVAVHQTRPYLSGFFLAIGKIMAKKHTLEKQSRPQPAYVMPVPNDDIAAYGWDLRQIREPDAKSADKKDPDKGKPIFSAPQETLRTMERYGCDAQFLCPKYLQILLDHSDELRKITMKAAETRYRVSDIDEIEATVKKIFEEVVLPDIVSNFDRIARSIAQFYAARLAHIRKFGNENG